MDDLLDLNWSDTSSKPAVSPQRQQQQPLSSKDAFADLLSFSSAKPTTTSSPPLNQQRVASSKPQIPPTLSPSFTLNKVGNTNNSNTSSPIQIHSPQRQLQQLSPSQNVPQTGANSNTGLDSLNDLLDPFGKSTKPKQPSNVPLNALRGQTKQETNASDTWNFDLLSSSVPKASPSVDSQNSIPLDPFDMDSLITATKKTTAIEKQETYYTDDDDDEDNDNPLGLLAQPEDELPFESTKSIKVTSTSTRQESSGSMDVSHDHNRQQQQRQQQQYDALLAQLLDMGFGVEESQMALEASGSKDLQSAIDLIVQQTEAIRRNAETKGKDKTDVVDTPTTAASSTATSSPLGITSDSFQQQKERLVSQATELGGYFYKNASLLVKSGKQKLSKAMEDYKEQQVQQRQGRPKWMTDTDTMEENFDATNELDQKFVDSDDDDVDNNNGGGESIERMEEERRQMEGLRRKQHKEQQRQRQPVFRSRLLDDNDNENDEQYISPSRRRQPAIKQQPSSSSSKVSSSSSSSFATNESIPKRPIIEATSNALQSATMHRQQGNDLYKLGQFADAEVAYTKAIDTLPEGHYHLVLLSNNRAMARLKTGHYKQCIEDCDIVLGLTEDIKGTVASQGGVEINGRDHTIKALHRKSEALEHLEKYKQALEVYQELIKWEGTGNVKVNQALARCRKIVHGPATIDTSIRQRQATATAPPRTITKSNVVTDYKDSKAVSAMRAQAAQQEADDAERLAKTDQVNERLAKWKQGKEANLRALLATLDTLLWAEANWKHIQMSELIQPKKCKINYLKAIGKVHPDKLPSTVTVEQRMIASGIFSTLNEAWETFKVENQL